LDYKKIFLTEIPTDGLTVCFDLPAHELDVQVENCKPINDIYFKGSIQRFGERYILSGQLSSRWIFHCDRCLKAFEQTLETPVLMHYIEEKCDGTISCSSDSGEEPEEIIKDAINLLDALKEQMILQIPMKLLCSETCRGLCSQCGKDLNKGPCKCPPPSTNSRFSKLKKLLEK
jgi:uncharacterized protein